MLNRKTLFILAVFTLLIAAGCQLSQPVAGTSTNQQTDTESAEGMTLTIGDIGNEPAETAKDYEMISQYFEQSLAEYGITKVEIRVAPSFDAMIGMINNGEVDIYFDSLYPSMIVNEGSNTRLILRQWRKGVSEYNSVIFAKKDSGFTKLSDLSGHIVAMDENFSTSGYLLPAAILKQEGLMLSEQSSLTAQVNSNEVGYIFSGDDDNTIQWIISDRVAAGAIDYPSFEQKLPQEVKDSMIILGESEMVPRAVVSVRDDLNSELIQALELTLLEMENSEEGQAVLKSMKTAKFDHFPEGLESTMNQLRSIYEMVTGETFSN